MMPTKNENPENDPLKELFEKIKNDCEAKEANKKPSKKPTKKPTSKSTKKPTSKPTKKPAKKTITTTADIYKLMSIIDTDPEMIEYRKNVKAVTSKVYEHLNSFILIGYTESGEPVQVTSAKSPKDYDALSTALQKYVVELLPKNPPGSSF